MKKLFRISLVVTLAVSSFAASAGERLDTQLDIADPVDLTSTPGDTRVKVASENYVKGAYNAALSEVGTVADAVDTLNADEDTTGSVLNAVKTQAAHADYSSSTNYSTGTIGKAIKDKVDNAGNFTATTDSDLIKNKTVVNAIKDVASAVSADTSRINSMSNAIGNTSYTGSSLTEAIHNLQETSGSLGNAAATKTGVENLIKSVTLTGDVATTSDSVYVADSWNGSTYTQVSFITSADKGTLAIDDTSVNYANAQPANP